MGRSSGCCFVGASTPDGRAHSLEPERQTHMAYTTATAVREMNRMDDQDIYPDQAITDAIAHAKTVIDRYTGTTWGNIETPAYDPFTVEIRRQWDQHILLRDIDGYSVMFPQTITTATHEDDGVLDTTNWRLRPSGMVIDKDRTAPTGWIVITGTAGRENTPNDDIEWCARTIARNHLINEMSTIPDRALSQPGEFGSIPLAQPGMKYPTGLPAVDARLSHYRHRHGPVY